MMSLTPIYLISGLVCLFWIAVHAILARHTRTFGVFCYLFGAIVITASGDVLLASVFKSEAIAQLVILFMAPTLIPLCCIYFYKMSREIKYGAVLQLWVAVPAALFAGALILTLLKGFDGTDLFLERLGSTSPRDMVFSDSWERIYFFWTVMLFRVVIIAEGILLLVYCINLKTKYHFHMPDLWHFLSHGKRIRVMQAQVNIALAVTFLMCGKVLLHPFFLHAPGWSVAISLSIAVLYFFFGLFALFSARTFISLEDIRTALRFNYNPDTQTQVTERIFMDMADGLSGESLTHVLARLSSQSGAPARKSADKNPSLSSAVFNAASAQSTWEPDSLSSRFQQLMQTQLLFLQPGLTLADVAERLDTNKTYVSKMVNKTYNMGFPEVLNIMRVDYACEHIRRHPDASQEEIARSCGFLSASSFNSTFKRITGYTPKVWAARTASSSGH